jgi:hypothetical protein
VSTPLLAFAAIALGQALQAHDGLYDAAGIALLTLAVIACAAAFVPRAHKKLRLSLHGVLAAGLLLQLFELFVHRPGSETALSRGLKASIFLHAALGVAAIAAAMIALGARRWRAAFWVAAAAQLFAAIWVIRETPEPHMDVWWAQQAGLEALVRGESPYSSRYPDIYRGGPPILVGFPYPPLTLLVDLPSFVVARDLRYGNAVAFALAGILIAHLSRTRAAAMAALTLLFSPRVLYFLESGWAEPAAILCFAAAVSCAVRHVRALPLALGFAAVSKQHMPLVLALAPLLRESLRGLPWRRFLLAGVLVAPLLSLLAVLPDVPGFIKSNVIVPAELPLRTDVLSYPAMLANELGFHSSGFAVVLGFGLAAATVATMWFVAPRTPAGFAAACATSFLVFFAFNKYAACNYYFFVIAALVCAVAAAAEAEVEPATA